MIRAPTRSPFVELAARSGFSLLDGASLPEALAERAAGVGMPALALTDRFDLGGAIRFARACERAGVRPIVGAVVGVRAFATERATDAGESADPAHADLALLCVDGEGYRNLSSLITEARLANPRGEPVLSLSALEGRSGGLVCLLETSRVLLAAGATAPSLEADVLAPERLRPPLARLITLFPDRFLLALENHGLPEDSRRCAAWLRLATREGIPWVPVNAPRYARPSDRIVHDALVCLRHDTTLDEAGERLLPNGEWYLKSAEEMAERWCFAAAEKRSSSLAGTGSERCPPSLAARPERDCRCEGCEAMRRTVEIAERCAFRFEELRPRLPRFPVPGGRSSKEFLRGLVETGAAERYGARFGEAHRRQVEHELRVIERLGLEDYFLIMWDIVRFANRRGILVQGRGSAANSAVCYCLGITAVDPIGMDLLFERFLSEERNEPPDIDLDIAHEEREEVLQYVYAKYGRERAAMVCESITYRGRMAVRDAARVLGFSTEVADRLSAEADHSGAADAARRLAEGGTARAGLDPESPRTRVLIRLVRGLEELPRHRSIHVGGFVLSERPLGEVVPIEPASMPDRTVIQWDKDDLDLPGLVKFDLLGLGMLTMLGKGIACVRRTRGVTLDLASIPPDDPDTYDMICAADTVGVFQIESRAQMNTLPRVRPRCFYDLVVEVALIRPGPIQGDMVHPYLRRRRGEEPVTYLDPRLEPLLKRTLGVPLFQEQGMKVAISLAGFTPAQADTLRRAMGFKRSAPYMEEVKRDLARGLAANGVGEEAAAKVFQYLTAFANYGFPESHAASFALLVYASAYLKRHYAPEFYAALLNSQPMGFYTPSSIVHDARRHGVEVRPPDLALSEWDCTLEGREGVAFREPRALEGREGVPLRERRALESEPPRRFAAAGSPPRRANARCGERLSLPENGDVGARVAGAARPEPALRLGLRLVHGLGPKAREKLQRAREAGPFVSVEDVVRRSGLGATELRVLAEAGAFESLWPGRREALWEVLRRVRGDAGPLAPSALEPAVDPGASGGAGVAGSRGRRRTARLPPMSRIERLAADYRCLGLSTEGHPMEPLRAELQARGVLSARELAERPAGAEVAVAGLAICRQRPGTAKGVMFVTLEDETGFANFVVMPDVQERYRRELLGSPLLLLEGVVEREGEVVTVRTRRAAPAGGRRMPIERRVSRDFR